MQYTETIIIHSWCIWVSSCWWREQNRFVLV